MINHRFYCGCQMSHDGNAALAPRWDKCATHERAEIYRANLTAIYQATEDEASCDARLGAIRNIAADGLGAKAIKA